MKKAVLLILCLAFFPLAAGAADKSADINGDGRVDAADYDNLMVDMQNQDTAARSNDFFDTDLNGDGQVNIQDLALFRKALRAGEGQ